MDIQTLAQILDLNHRYAQKRPLSEFFQAAGETARSLAHANAFAIWVPEHESGRDLLAIATSWANEKKTLQIPITKSVAGWAMQYEQPFQVARENQYPLPAEMQPDFPIPVRDALAVPILFRKEVLGTLAVYNSAEGHAFNFEDIAVLEHVATLTGIAIWEARMRVQSQRQQREIEKLEKMKSDFIAIASHELRTPLGLILGHATFLREIVPEEFQEQLDVVVRNAERLKKLIESMAQIKNYQSGTSSLRSRTFVLQQLLETLVQDFSQKAAQANVKLELVTGKDPIYIHGDESKLATAFSNIIENGILFNKPGGRLRIEVKRTVGHTKILFMDTGKGIPPDELPHIFDRFYQVESHLTREHGGMGLGLSIAKAMIELHGGRIWAESEPGKGSVFTVLLPQSTIPSQPAEIFQS
jgi:signal transduction histidine kinase